MRLEDLIQYLKEDTLALRTPPVEMAFRAVDRRYFVPDELKDEAYEDYPLPIGYGATISQPTTVALMLEKLDVREGQKVLDIGSGSGWTTALLAHLVGPSRRVTGLEIVPELVALGNRSIAEYHSHILKNMRMVHEEVPAIREAKKGVVGLPEEAPFDRILVSAAAREVPQELIEQLKPDGVMVIPVGKEGEVQRLARIHKKQNGQVETEEYPGFVFVPLR